MTPAVYRDLLRLARRHSRVASEAEDLVQDALLAAVAAGRDAGAAASRPWLAGVIRRRAAFLARSAARRARRDDAWQVTQAHRPIAAGTGPTDPDPLLADLPPALKAVAALAFTGHSRPEIAYLLGIGDAALRQRLAALRRRFASLGAALSEDTPGLKPGLDYGRIRDKLRAGLARHGGVFASHDPDGHLFVIRRSQSEGPRQQTGDNNPGSPK